MLRYLSVDTIQIMTPVIVAEDICKIRDFNS